MMIMPRHTHKTESANIKLLAAGVPASFYISCNSRIRLHLEPNHSCNAAVLVHVALARGLPAVCDLTRLHVPREHGNALLGK